VPEIVLQRARVLPVVGELEAGGVAQHVRVTEAERRKVRRFTPTDGLLTVGA
jgi:hypothetical protein